MSKLILIGTVNSICLQKNWLTELPKLIAIAILNPMRWSKTILKLTLKVKMTAK